VKFVPNIEDDLARRDFTVNAMAYSPTRGFADPFGGRADLDAQILRAVGNPEIRFQEDSLRILRGVRFAVRYGLMPETQTLDAMFRLAPLMENLARERVFEELCKIGYIRVAGKGGSLLHTSPLLQMLLRLSKPHINEILLNAFAGVFLKQTGKVPPVKA
jgi:tRNA nucleotidyltransferase (CCA-adding enzyme)